MSAVNEPGGQAAAAKTRTSPYSEARAAAISILPLVIAGGSVKSEGGEGWRQAWEQLDLAQQRDARHHPPAAAGSRAAIPSRRCLPAMPRPSPRCKPTMATGRWFSPWAKRPKANSSRGWPEPIAWAPINFGRSDKLSADGTAIAREAPPPPPSASSRIAGRLTRPEPGADRRQIPGGRRRAAAAQAPRPATAEVPRNVVAQVEFSASRIGRIFSGAADERRRNRGARGQCALGAGSLGHLRLCRLARAYRRRCSAKTALRSDEREGTFVLRSR